VSARGILRVVRAMCGEYAAVQRFHRSGVRQHRPRRRDFCLRFSTAGGSAALSPRGGTAKDIRTARNAQLFPGSLSRRLGKKQREIAFLFATSRRDSYWGFFSATGGST